MKTYKAVLFDAGNTLLYTSPSVAEIYHALAKQYGCQASVDEVREVSKRTYLELKEALFTGNPEYRVSDEEDLKRWTAITTATFRQLGLNDCADKIAEELVRTFKDPKIWRLFPEVIEVLSRLKSEGYKLGIISNWSSALLHLCAALGLERYMDVISVSAVVGWEKPSPRIFQKALSSIKVLPEEALYVGDTYQDDILGARNVGMEAILIDRLSINNYPGPRIQDLRELYPLVRCP